jgi:hypothetical protein
MSGQRTASGDWPLTILVMGRTSGAANGVADVHPDTTLDGHPARRSPKANGGQGLQLWAVQGLYLELATHDTATAAQLPGGIDGLFRAMSLHPNSRDWQ